jgi:hypothetical protein
MDDARLSRWLGFAFDATIIASLTTLTVSRVVPVTVFVALVGPLVGSRLALRSLREGGGGPPDHHSGGSAMLSIVVAVSWLTRRALGLV